MIEMFIGIAAITGTVMTYLLSKKVHDQIASTFSLPILTSTIVLILILLFARIPYATYMIGGEWISDLLGPAVVALAYPLYQQREVLKRLIIPIFLGTLFGALLGVSTGVVFAKWLEFDSLIIYALSPKSVTTPVAMVITESLGGPTPLAAVFVMIAGIGGVIMSPFIFKLFRIDHSIGRGVGIGCASHAIGTAKAMESSQLEGSVSTIAMIMSAVIVSMITPAIIELLI